MDCQGLFDPQDSHCRATDTLITLFALELSNIHILNLKGDIKSTDLEHLEVKCLLLQHTLHCKANISK